MGCIISLGMRKHVAEQAIDLLNEINSHISRNACPPGEVENLPPSVYLGCAIDKNDFVPSLQRTLKETKALALRSGANYFTYQTVSRYDNKVMSLCLAQGVLLKAIEGTGGHQPMFSTSTSADVKRRWVAALNDPIVIASAIAASRKILDAVPRSTNARLSSALPW